MICISNLNNIKTITGSHTFTGTANEIYLTFLPQLVIQFIRDSNAKMWKKRYCTRTSCYTITYESNGLPTCDNSTSGNITFDDTNNKIIIYDVVDSTSMDYIIIG